MDASFDRIDGAQAHNVPHGTPFASPQSPSGLDTPPAPASPVVLSVPHAGRDYPPTLRAALRLPESALVVLEDRHVDAVARAAQTNETMLVQRRARAWIDLNRSEYERDPRVDDGVRPQAQSGQSMKIRSGLGLVPRRAGGAGDLWRGRFTGADVARRIAEDHRPYHATLAATLAAARARFGVAILVDIHSMPTVGPHARLVLGDRFGATSDARFLARIEGAAAQMGIATQRNTPYAGAHILQTHAAPARGIHAVQVEIDRALYLDSRLDGLGPGFDRTVALLRSLLAAVADEALAGAPPFALAAE